MSSLALTMPVGLHLSDEVQQVLEYAAGWRLDVPDRANGVLDVEDASLMRIPLVNAPGRYALIDAEDYPLVQRYRWRSDDKKYAVAGTGQLVVRMHRLILMIGPSLIADHISGDTLDNRKANLRPCGPNQNMWNSRLSKKNKTGVKGVSATAEGLFKASVKAKSKTFAKEFRELADAAAWVAEKRIQVHGEFARHA